MRITRSLVFVATVVIGVLLLVSGAQPWVVLSLSSAESSARELIVLGGTLAPAFVGVSLVYVAAVMVALISRPVVRIICALLAAAASVVAGTVVLLVMSDPVAAARIGIARLTGVSDTEQQRNLVDSVSLQPWVYVALVTLVFAVAVALMILRAGRTWTTNANRYERRKATASSQSRVVRTSESDPHETWDDLSGGGDPTREVTR